MTLTGTSHHKLLMAPQLLSSANKFKFVSSKEQTTENGKSFSASNLNLFFHQSTDTDSHITISKYKWIHMKAFEQLF